MADAPRTDGASSADEPSDLIEPGGVNGGSVAAERDRRPSGDVAVGEVDGHLERDAPPPGDVVGAPGDELSQQLGVGEG